MHIMLSFIFLLDFLVAVFLFRALMGL